MKNLVSIVIPTMNRCELLSQALESCRRQTYEAIEIVIVDGGVDGTEDYVRGLGDSRIVYVKQPRGGGMIAAFNLGMERARGAYLTWLSDDDIYFPEAVAALTDALDRDMGVDFVYAPYDKVDMQGNFLGHGRVEDPAWLDRDNCIGHCFLYRRKVYDEIGVYHAEPLLAEDYEYWLRVREKFRMKRISPVLFHHRMHAASLTMTHGPSEMAVAVELARRPFVPAWKHHFFTGERHYHASARAAALRHVFVSLGLCPFHGPSWRLLALLVFPAAAIRWIRALRIGRRVSSCAG